MSLLLCGGLPKAAHKNAVCIHINLGLWPKKSTVTRNQATLRFLLASDQSEAQFGQESSIRDHFQLFSHWLWLLVIRSSTRFLTPLFLSPEAATLDDIAVTLWETDQMHWNRFWISDPAKSPWGDCWSTIDFTWKKLFKLLVLNQPCFFARFFPLMPAPRLRKNVVSLSIQSRAYWSLAITWYVGYCRWTNILVLLLGSRTF